MFTPSSLVTNINCFDPWSTTGAENPYSRERINTVDLIVLIILDQLLFTYKKAILIRKSTVLNSTSEKDSLTGVPCRMVCRIEVLIAQAQFSFHSKYT
jgi:hypothetical protein